VSLAPAVEVTGLTKVFEKGRRTIWQRVRRQPDQRETFVAVNGIDLRVERGEIFGVLGPNGAGKTTTLRMLATLLEPTSGEVKILGIEVGSVTKVSPRGDSVKIEMKYDHKYKLPADAISVVVANSLVSDRYIQLAPAYPGSGPTLKNGANIPFEEMVKLDYLYVTNWSLWEDVRLLLRTLPVVLARRGAN